MPSTYTTNAYDVPQLPVNAIAITPSDATLYDATTTYPGGITVFVTVTGDLTVTPAGGGADIVLAAVPAFLLIPFRVKQVKAATTAVVIGLS